jgi:hypothetical protein
MWTGKNHKIFPGSSIREAPKRADIQSKLEISEDRAGDDGATAKEWIGIPTSINVSAHIAR